MNRLLPFIIFLSIFLTIYGLLHYYFYIKMKNALALGPLNNYLLIIYLSFMIISPILINISHKYDSHLLSIVLSYWGYMWMGVLFLFFSIHLLIDIYNMIIKLSAWIFSTTLLDYRPGNRTSLFFTLLLVTSIIIYGGFEAKRIKVETITLKTERLPPHVDNLRIVQICDMHLSIINNVGFSQEVVNIIKSLKPDILVSTGDLIESGLRQDKQVAAILGDIKTPYGKFAITGNHEFHTGINKAVEFTEKAGFRMLRNEGTLVGDFVNILGIDDPTAIRSGQKVSISEEEVFKKFSENSLTILLKHQPRVDERIAGMFDLQLSGHTHKGQIFPFGLITSLFYPYNDGLFEVEKSSYLYVSRGTGTWGPPVRFLSPPEITVIDFKRE
ncbi:MAG: metallophosphoesterase [Deltaproteobacteria bacterium]|nr:metallophosphoesterase [Deltaproteobacteria bacterium]